jgi:hypothetical protein
MEISVKSLQQTIFEEMRDLRDGIATPSEARALADLAKVALESFKFERDMDFRMSLSGNPLSDVRPNPPIQWFDGRCCRFVVQENGRLRSWWEYLYPRDLVELIQVEAERLGAPLNKYGAPSLTHSKDDIFSGKTYVNPVPISRISHLKNINTVGEHCYRIFSFEDVLPNVKLGVGDTDARFAWHPPSESNKVGFVEANISVTNEGRVWQLLREYSIMLDEVNR